MGLGEVIVADVTGARHVGFVVRTHYPRPIDGGCGLSRCGLIIMKDTTIGSTDSLFEFSPVRGSLVHACTEFASVSPGILG